MALTEITNKYSTTKLFHVTLSVLWIDFMCLMTMKLLCGGSYQACGNEVILSHFWGNLGIMFLQTRNFTEFNILSNFLIYIYIFAVSTK